VDDFDDPPIEVIRGHVQVRDIFNIVLWAAMGVLLSANASHGDASAVLVALSILLFELSAAWLLASRRSRIEVHRAGLVRRYLLRTSRYRWERIDKVVLGPGHRVFNPRPSPVLVLISGRRVELPQLRTPLWVPLSGVTISAESRELVEAIELRVDHSDAPEIVEPVTGVSAPPRAIAVVPLLACLGFFVAALAVAMLVVPFIGSTADVDPSHVAAGRVYYGERAADGAVTYWVDCTRPLTSAFGSDAICRADGRSKLRASVIGLVIAAALAALFIWYVRNLRRRHERWNEATAGLNA
jgi:hypothetical protein